MPDETVTRAAMRALVECDLVGELAMVLKIKHGWRSSVRGCHQRVLQMLNDGYGSPRHFPANDLPEVLALTGLDYVTPILTAALDRGERAVLERRIAELERRDERRQMATVRHGQGVRRHA